jgi:AraC-like DNA-binding protein
MSTEMLPERDRMSAFREEYARRDLNIDVAPVGSGKPRMDITLLKLGPVGVGRLAGNAVEVIRDAHHVKDGHGDFSLTLLTQGPLRSLQAGQDHSVNVGSAVVYYRGQPCRAGTPHGAEVTQVLVPAAMLKALVPYPEDRAGHVLRPAPVLRLLDGYLASLLTLDELPPAELAPHIALHLVDLVAAAIGPTAEAAEIIDGRGLKAARQRAILAEITRRSSDPAFDIDGIARRLGLSRRSVQYLLDETGKSFTDHVTERRLERAYAMLTDPHLARRRVIDIAFAVGFGDVSHFNRLFRRRFGDRPSAFRRYSDGFRR